jgi:hypothetical protein
LNKNGKGIRRNLSIGTRKRQRTCLSFRGKVLLEEIKPQACLLVLGLKHVFNLYTKHANIYMDWEIPSINRESAPT